MYIANLSAIIYIRLPVDDYIQTQQREMCTNYFNLSKRIKKTKTLVFVVPCHFD